jgi:ADP-ribose pyrophosphatase YjhB (NUDIX family)
MKYCSECGSPIARAVPEGDDRERFVCPGCGRVHYENPKLVVGCIPEWRDRLLLCRRAIEPRKGLWTLPAGYLENGESAADGARRELYEEAGAEVGEMTPFAIFDILHVGQLYLMFRAPLVDTTMAAGAESLEVDLFAEDEIPWPDIAFPVIEETLRRYFSDRRKGCFVFHSGSISRKLRIPPSP